jgi:hypothetical protein
LVVADGEDGEGLAVTNLSGDGTSQRVVEQVDLNDFSQVANGSGDRTGKLVLEHVQDDQVLESTNSLGDIAGKLVFIKHTAKEIDQLLFSVNDEISPNFLSSICRYASLRVLTIQSC